MPIRYAAAESVACSRHQLLDRLRTRLVNPLVFANYQESQHALLRRQMLTNYACCDVEYPPVRLVGYPRGTIVDASSNYLLYADGAFVEEQSRFFAGVLDEVRLALDREGPGAPHIKRDCILLARHGQAVWGHWVMEILTKAVVAEAAYPGRFAFVIAAEITELTAERSYSTAIIESLAAYGIHDDRLIRIGGGQIYRFDSLHDVVGLVTDGLHPGALQALRAAKTSASVPESIRRVLTLRRGQQSRSVHNDRSIENLLAGEGFVVVDLTSLSFQSQIALFRNVDIAVSSLGSDCAPLMFAPPETRLATVAPSLWNDGYFVKLFQLLRFIYADVRGPSTNLGTTDAASASHMVDPPTLSKAMSAMSRFLQQTPRTSSLVIDGEEMPRDVGAPVLRIRFGTSGTATDFMGSGWAAPEAQMTWSVGPKSTLVIPPGVLPIIDLWLRIEGFGVSRPPYLEMRPLTISINRHDPVLFEICAFSRLHYRIRKETLEQDREVTIDFEHPICVSPFLLGASEDTRPLGFGFASVEFFVL